MSAKRECFVLQFASMDRALEATDSAHRLSWLERWRLRQQFAGNYAVQDPSVPL